MRGTGRMRSARECPHPITLLPAPSPSTPVTHINGVIQVLKVHKGKSSRASSLQVRQAVTEHTNGYAFAATVQRPTHLPLVVAQPGRMTTALTSAALQHSAGLACSSAGQGLVLLGLWLPAVPWQKPILHKTLLILLQLLYDAFSDVRYLTRITSLTNFTFIHHSRPQITVRSITDLPHR